MSVAYICTQIFYVCQSFSYGEFCKGEKLRLSCTVLCCSSLIFHWSFSPLQFYFTAVEIRGNCTVGFRFHLPWCFLVHWFHAWCVNSFIEGCVITLQTVELYSCRTLHLCFPLLGYGQTDSMQKWSGTQLYVTDLSNFCIYIIITKALRIMQFLIKNVILAIYSFYSETNFFPQWR
jgi:hypothetical protein